MAEIVLRCLWKEIFILIRNWLIRKKWKKQQTNRQFFFLLSDDDENQWFVVFITPFSIKIDHYFLSSLQTKLLHNKFLDSLIVNNNGISTTTTKRTKKTTHHPNRISIASFWIDVVVVYFYFFFNYTLLHKRNERKNEKTIIIEKTLIIENPLISIKQQWMREWVSERVREREKNGYPPSYSADVFGLLLFVCLILDFFFTSHPISFPSNKHYHFFSIIMPT